MGQLRKEAIEQLCGAKKFMQSMSESNRQNIPLKGKKTHTEISGVERTFMEYTPEDTFAPAYFDIHGGGFAWGTISDGDEWCALLAQEMGYHVFSLDYPMSPDAEFPRAIEYLYQTISYIRENADKYDINPNRLLIGGRSAGANLATALCIYALRQGNYMFEVQVLDHPWLDLCNEIPWSERCNAKGVLPEELMKMLAYGYTDSDNWRNVLVSPILAKREVLEKLPQTIIQTAELDSLEVDGRRYAKLLIESGNKVIFRCAKGVTHGFTETYTKEGEEGRNWLLHALKEITGRWNYENNISGKTALCRQIAENCR